MYVAAVVYVFTSNAELKTAVNLWFSNNELALETYGHISTWRTGNVTDMAELFCADDVYNHCTHYHSAASSFNEDISGWETESVTSMERMFMYAGAVSQPIGGWNTSKVESMKEMFESATSFSEPLDGWETGAVLDMRYMYHGTTVVFFGVWYIIML